MKFEELKNPVLQKKLRNAKTPAEILELAREEGIEITDEQLQGISGGLEWTCSDDACDDYCSCQLDCVP